MTEPAPGTGRSVDTPSGSHTRRLAGMWTRGTAGIVALGLALVSCYGTLALAAFLSLLGLRLAVNETAWSGAILICTVLAAAVVAAGLRRHRSPPAVAAAVAGAGLVAYALVVDYHLLIELAGFVMLGVAVWRDVYLRRAH